MANANPGGATGEQAEERAAPWAQTFARRIRQTRWLILLVWVVVAILGVVGNDRVIYDPDVLVYFDKERPERQAFDEVEARFGQSREIVTLVVPREGDVFSPTILRAMARLATMKLAREEVSAVRTPLSEIGLTPAQTLALSDDELRGAGARLEASTRNNDGRLQSLASSDGTVAAVAAIVPDFLDNDEARRVAAGHRALKTELAGDVPEAEFLQTGRIVIDDAFLRESQEGVDDYSIPLLVILTVIVAIALGSLSLTLAVMTLVFITLTATVGALGWSGMAVNGISSASPVVLMGLMVASSIHLVMAWQEALRRGASRADALAIALDRNVRPIVLSVATTLISFLFLNLSEAPPFRDLGNIVAMGLFGVLALTFTLLPALLTVCPRSFGRHRIIVEVGLGALGVFCAQRFKWVATASVALMAAALAGIALITVDDTFSHYFDERYEVRRATDLFETKLSGTTIIDILVDTGAEGGALTPETLGKVASLSSWLLERPEVARLDSLDTVQKAISDAGFRVTPEGIVRAAGDMAAEGRPRVLEPERRYTRISIVMRGVSSRDTLAFTDDARAQAASLFGAGQVEVTGLPVLSANLSIGSARAMVVAMTLALAVISLLLIATLRDWRLGLLSLAPNLLPIAIAFGIWGYAVGQVSFAVTVVAALTYGIVVDDTVHLLAKYQRYRRELGDQMAAIRRAFRTVGFAVVATSIALGASFMPFALSGFLVNRHFGALTALTLLGAMLADLLILPALLARFDRRRKSGKAEGGGVDQVAAGGAPAR